MTLPNFLSEYPFVVNSFLRKGGYWLVLLLLFSFGNAWGQEPPTFIVPPNVEVSCEDAGDLSATGEPTEVMDDLDPDPVVSFDDVIVISNCPGNYFIERLWRVTDSEGLFTTDFQIITVRDNTDPTFTVPPNIELTNGEDPFDLTVTGQPSELMDNCSSAGDLVIRQGTDVITDLGDCFLLIERPWAVEDECGNSQESVQLITVLDMLDLSVSSLSVPQCPNQDDGAIVLAVSSNSSYTTDWNIDAYDGLDTLQELPAAVYTVIVTNVSGCTDSLTIDLSAVEDTEAPVFITCPSDTTVLLTGSSTATLFAWELPEVTDNCTAAEDIFLVDNGYPTGEGIFALGEQTITYLAVDQFANESDTCRFTVSVERLNDVTFYFDSLDWQLTGNRLRMPVKVLNFTEILGYQLEVSTEPDLAVDSLVITVPTGQDMVNWEPYLPGSVGVLWYSTTATPQSQPDSTIVFYIDAYLNGNVEDCLNFTMGETILPPVVILANGSEVIPTVNDGAFCGTPDLMLAGRITGTSDLPLAEVPVNGPGVLVTSTDQAGQYQFEGIPWGSDIMIRPTYDEFPLYGVNVADIIAIRNHLLRIETFGQAWQYVAADTDASGKTSLMDMVFIRDVLLNRIPTYPGVPSWQFLPRQIPLVLSMDLDSVPDFVTAIEYENLTEDILFGDFLGVKTGDVNGTVTGLSPDLIDPAPGLVLWNAQATADHTMVLELEGLEQSAAACQISLMVQPAGAWRLLDGKDQEENGWAYHYEEAKGELRIVYYADRLDKAITTWPKFEFTSDDFTGPFELALNDKYHHLSADQQALAQPLELFEKTISIATEVPANSNISFEIYPNPFKDQISLYYLAAQAETIDVSVVTLAGVPLKAWQLDIARGTGSPTLAMPPDWPAGVYLLRIESEKETIVRKIIKY